MMVALSMTKFIAHVAPYLIWVFCAQDLLAAIAYAVAGEYQKALYWLAGATICATVPK